MNTDFIPVYVPEYIEYMTQWTDYRLPEGHCIIDKSVCGCGFTEYCIRDCNPIDLILCSPRKTLLQNKKDQHDTEDNIYYYQSEFLSSSFKEGSGKSYTPDSPEYNSKLMEYKAEVIRKHVFNCRQSQKHCVILVTYDSYHTIREALGDSIVNFRVVVDEFQCVFMDAFFKAEIENKFFEELKLTPHVTYLSATPMTSKYLKMIPEFDALPYYKFVWPPSRLMSVRIQKSQVSDLGKSILHIIKTYKEKPYNCNFVLDKNGNPYYSREAVFYVNSVQMIKRIIKRAGLTPSECNIICSDEDCNKRSIASIKSPDKKKFKIGSIPKRGESHKMFTFCTRTAYLGSDFYSTSARSFIFSDANVKSLSLDIRLDMSQILGRQRLKENPWHNEVVIFYKTIYKGADKITEENFMKMCFNKKKQALDVQRDYQNTNENTKNYLRDLTINYFNTYTGREVGIYTGIDRNGNVVFNPFLEIADMRAWEISQKENNTDISVFNTIGDVFGVESIQEYLDPETEFVEKFDKAIQELPDVRNQFEAFCVFFEKYKEDPDMIDVLIKKYEGTRYLALYTHYGYDICKSVHFNCTELSKRLEEKLFTDQVLQGILSKMSIGQKYTCKFIKESLNEIYKSLGIIKAAKSTDLEDYFIVRSGKVFDETSQKWQKGMEIISLR